MRIRIKHMILIALLSLATYNFTKTSLEVFKSSQRLYDLKSSVDAKLAENSKLKDLAAYTSSPGFIEAEARNKLNLVKPGETVLIPVTQSGDVLGANLGDSKDESLTVADLYKEEVSQKETNFERWMRLFFDFN